MTVSRPLAILLVGDYANDARLGSAKVAHKLREEFVALGHRCDALFADAIGQTPSNRQLRQLVSPMLAARAIGRALASERYDVVDAASAEGLWFGIERRLGAHRGTAYVCRSNGLEHLNYERMLADSDAGLLAKPWTRRLWYPAARLSQVAAAARLADRLLLLNDADRRYARAHRWQPESRIDVVPHGVSDRFLTDAPADAPRGAGVLFCGAWDHVKGIAYLVDAFQRLAAGGRPVPLTILGPGPAAHEVLAAFPSDVRPHVTVVDRVPEDRVIAEYRRHDLLVFPSTYEGFGLVVLEALSQGLPVVATPVGSVPGLVRDGETGVVVPPRDGAALAAAVRRLMESPADRARMSANAVAAVRSLSWRRTAERTIDVYRRALAGRAVETAAA
jgi:glycosyltransferase involved in cell wall biosynthesis